MPRGGSTIVWWKRCRLGGRGPDGDAIGAENNTVCDCVCRICLKGDVGAEDSALCKNCLREVGCCLRGGRGPDGRWIRKRSTVLCRFSAAYIMELYHTLWYPQHVPVW